MKSPTRRRVLQLATVATALPFGTFRARAADEKERLMRRIFITGSTDGLGRAAAVTLMREGHQVVLHARSAKRATAVADLAPRAAGVVIGDLSSAAETRSIADQVSFTMPASSASRTAGPHPRGTPRCWR
jgi:hypothetical protein